MIASIQEVLWADKVARACLAESGGDVDAALLAAEYIISTQPFPDEVEIEQTGVAFAQEEDGHWVTTEEGQHIFISYSDGHLKTKPGGKVLAKKAGPKQSRSASKASPRSPISKPQTKQPLTPQSQAAALASKLTSILDDPKYGNMDPKLRDYYKEQTNKAINMLTPTAFSIFQANIKGMEFFNDADEFTDYLIQSDPKWKKALKGKKGNYQMTGACGTSDPNTGVVSIAQPGKEAMGTMLHEFMHTIDTDAPFGPNGFKIVGKFSRRKEWFKAWQEELKGGNLTGYAASEAEEGFAEFGSCLFDPNIRNDLVAQDFPKCYALFKSWGLA